ncbi:1321_t:CDS:2 [Ambispora gerdemannii]|uniref:PIH1 domain-containing protein 1 n=1 Tax=Ambispora gerdemannii TaxID=144530 RepID=A0A9N8Z078_9GLOM|nr:1321_t:CDS:2 [Ambispora gerdemannii]
MAIPTLVLDVGEEKLPSLFSLNSSTDQIENDTKTEEALWDEFSSQLVKDPESLKTFTSQYQKMSEVSSESLTLKIDPTPGYVVKTHLLEGTTMPHPAGVKLLINVVHSEKVPEPSPATDQEIQQAMEVVEGASYPVPLVVGNLREDVDKEGSKHCLVCDVVLNTKIYKKTEKNYDFKLFIAEHVMEHIEDKHKLRLNREIAFPKLRCKGKLETINLPVVGKQRAPMITEVSLPTAATKNKATTISKETPSPRLPLDQIQNPQQIAKSLPIPITEPKYSIAEEKIRGKNYVKISIDVPKLEATKSTTLDIEPSRLIFYDPQNYLLDINLPGSIDIETAIAQFVKPKKKIVLKAEKNIV